MTDHSREQQQQEKNAHEMKTAIDGLPPLETLRELLSQRNRSGLRDLLKRHAPVEDRVRLLDLFSLRRAASLLAALPAKQIAEFVSRLPQERAFCIPKHP